MPRAVRLIQIGRAAVAKRPRVRRHHAELPAREVVRVALVRLRELGELVLRVEPAAAAHRHGDGDAGQHRAGAGANENIDTGNAAGGSGD